MDTTAVILILVALAGGALVGWFVGSRPAADWKARHAERDGAAKEHEDNFKRAVAELGQAQVRIATLEANAENFDKQLTQLKEAREDLLALVGMVEAGTLVPVVSRTHPLLEAAEAVRHVEGGHARGKVVLTMDPVGV